MFKNISKLLYKLIAWLERQSGYPDLSAASKLRAYNHQINTFDIDGVIHLSKWVGGVYPGPRDHIITGRSYEERPETERMLLRRGIKNRVHYNPLPFEEKTRKTAGEHKASIIKMLQVAGYVIGCHFEDDEIQASVIRERCPDVPVVLLVHDMTEKENVRHLE